MKSSRIIGKGGCCWDVSTILRTCGIKIKNICLRWGPHCHSMRDAMLFKKILRLLCCCERRSTFKSEWVVLLYMLRKVKKIFKLEDRQTMLLGEIDLLIQQLINCKIVMELQNCHWIQGNNESLQGQYRFCPEGPTSWRKYQKDISNKEKITIKKLSDQCIL